jgi:BlaI family transcriptional regulator, penicillinase repressor
MKKLTTAEEEVMQILWKLEKGFIKDILELMPDPKPPYTTVLSVIRVLEKKAFISHTQYGNTYEYYPLVQKEDYAGEHFNQFLSHYFNNSFPKMAAFFARENNLTFRDLEEIIRLTEIEIEKTSAAEESIDQTKA